MTDTTTARTLIGRLYSVEIRKKQQQCRNNGAAVSMIGGVVLILIEGLTATNTGAPFVFWSTGVAVLLSGVYGGFIGWFVGNTIVSMVGGVVLILIEGLTATNTGAPFVFWSTFGVYALAVVLLSGVYGGVIGWFVGKTMYPVAYFIFTNIILNVLWKAFGI